MVHFNNNVELIIDKILMEDLPANLQYLDRYTQEIEETSKKVKFLQKRLFFLILEVFIQATNNQQLPKT